ncbi:MBL fold metallo-hydrolase [Nitrosomonas ureae]|nr:MBL fold metallo-hydrolase [Nitrosomonas ureae]
MDNRAKSLISRGHLVCHCLLVELNDSLVLIDTGLGLQDVAAPQTRLSRFFLTLLRPEFRVEMTAVRQVQRLGFAPRDVHHIILTHLDFDHAGGLDDFPNAQVHMLQSERDNAFSQRSWLDRQRFRPQQWSTRGNWHVYPSSQGENWFGFDSVRELKGIPPEILMVPLLGHTLGHTGIAIKIGGHWLFHTGDAYFFYKEMDFRQPGCTPGLRFYQWMMEKNRQLRLQNQRRLRELRHKQNGRVTVFCGHDVTEFERLSGRSAEVSAEHFVL